MRTLSQYNELIVEFKQDNMPKCVVIIGGPGAGKTYWMSEHTHKDENGVGHHEDSGFKKLFGTPNVAKKLDMDHNLEQVQKENAKAIAKILLTGVKEGADKEWFDKFIKTKQDIMDRAVDYGKKSPMVDLSLIDYNFIAEWGAKYNESKQSRKVLQEFQNAFVKEYWRKIFASDFSRRDTSKAEYKKTFWRKLSGLVDFKGGEEIYDGLFSDSDVCIAITGDDISKISEIQNASKGHHAVYIIYLDIPLEMSIAADQKRDRHVGPEMVKDKIEGVHKTWDQLKDRFEDMGIWKMYHLETPVGSHPNWSVTQSFINKKLIGASALKEVE